MDDTGDKEADPLEKVKQADPLEKDKDVDPLQKNIDPLLLSTSRGHTPGPRRGAGRGRTPAGALPRSPRRSRCRR